MPVVQDADSFLLMTSGERQSQRDGIFQCTETRSIFLFLLMLNNLIALTSPGSAMERRGAGPLGEAADFESFESSSSHAGSMLKTRCLESKRA